MALRLRFDAFQDRGCNAQLVHTMRTIVARSTERMAESCPKSDTSGCLQIGDNASPDSLFTEPLPLVYVYHFDGAARLHFLGFNARTGSSPCGNNGSASGPSVSFSGPCSRC